MQSNFTDKHEGLLQAYGVPNKRKLKPKSALNGVNGVSKNRSNAKVIAKGVKLTLQRHRAAEAGEDINAVINTNGKRENGFHEFAYPEGPDGSADHNISSSGLTSEKNTTVSTKKLKKIRIGRRNIQKSFEHKLKSLIQVFNIYLAYFVFIVHGYFKYLMRSAKIKEADGDREGYVPLYASFESFYTRLVSRADCLNIPGCSVPGEYINLMERVFDDYGWSFQMTGKAIKCINLASYNYLGFAQNHGACTEAAVEKLKQCGTSVCSTRQELDASYIEELDKLVARFVGAEDAITCAMGFATNALNLPAILNKGCLVLSDEKNHASIILGLRLSGATVHVFRHNNMKSLEKRIRQGIINGQPKTHLPWEKIVIVVEGVYSMEGSIVPLPKILDLKRKYGTYIYLDEAHSIGAMGANGRGVVDYWGLDPKDIDILMGTFTKSFGSAGGYIAGSRELIQMLRDSSHAHCYGTAMSPPVAQQVLTSMKIIMGEDGTIEGIKKIAQLARNSKYFRQKLKQKRFIVYGNDDSPVVPVALYVPTKIPYIVREMIKRGVATVGVAYPVTPLLHARMRFCVSAAHTKEILDHAIDAMSVVGDNIQIRNSNLPVNKGVIRYEDAELEDLD